MILTAKHIERLRPLDPILPRTRFQGVTFGLSPAGYDLRIAEAVDLEPGGFTLAHTVESFNMPLDVIGVVHDKSTWARLGLSVFNTIIDPGFRGRALTLELSNRGPDRIRVPAGVGICQVLFQWTAGPTEGYSGKYQDAPAGATPAIFEPPDDPAAAAVEVYARPECIFNYCPHRDECRAHDHCHAPVRTGFEEREQRA